MQQGMMTITHRHSRPHHNDEPDTFLHLDAEARAAAGEVIAAATSAEQVTDRPPHELSREAIATSASTNAPELASLDASLVELGVLPYHGRRNRRP